MGAPNDIRTPYRVGKVIVSNERGLHARAAAKFVKLANKFSSEIWVEKDDEEINGKSIMGLMMLAAGNGSKLKFIANGADADKMLKDMTALFERKFEES